MSKRYRIEKQIIYSVFYVVVADNKTDAKARALSGEGKREGDIDPQPETIKSVVEIEV